MVFATESLSKLYHIYYLAAWVKSVKYLKDSYFL